MNLNELELLIRENVREILAIEQDGPPDPLDAVEDHEGNYLDDLMDSVKMYIKKVQEEDDENSYNALVKIYDALTDAINNQRDPKNREKLEQDYEPILGMIHNVIGGGGSGEKFYTNE